MIQAAAVLLAIVISPGLYHDPSGAAIYVGAQHEVPDRSNAQYLDARNGLTGELKSHQHLAQTCRLHEERRLVRYDGVLGVFAVLCRQCAARDADAIYDAFHSDARV
ncbi:MAG TPA: hypothetical protein VFE36_08195, partial [Candidatus Baltobacteraceae bacterium]|nr:hypothetical protein [Candidatus Baltobacteraceae bacterium]